MAIYWWGVAFAACIGGMFVPGLELPFGIMALGTAIGGGIAVNRKLREKSSKENRAIVGDRRVHNDLVQRHDTHNQKLDGLDAKADAQREQLNEMKKMFQGAIDTIGTVVGAASIDASQKQQVDEERKRLENWVDFLWPVYTAAVQNDLLGREIVGYLQQLLTNTQMSPQMRIHATMELFVMYHSERKETSVQPSVPAKLRSGTVILNIPDESPPLPSDDVRP